MKNLLLLGCIPLLMAACTGNGSKKTADSSADSATLKSSTNADSGVVSRAKALPQLISLNGVSLADADSYVSDFINRASVYKSPTSVWFSKAHVDSLKALLEREGADGIRIYFAKYPNGHNIIMVSTRKIGLTHQDYFEHSAPILLTAEAKGIVDYAGKNGTSLYDPALKCPATDNCNISYEHYLKCSEAADRVRNFSNDKFTTTSEWFDIGVLGYLARELDSSPTADGVRIYYARKPDPDIKKSTHGFVIVTTKTSTTNSNIHEDYYTCNSVKFRLDNGEQCPNNCTGVTWPKP